MIPSVDREAHMETARTVTVASGDSLQRVFVLRNADNVSLPVDRLVLEAGSMADVTIVVMPGVSCDLSLTVDLQGNDARCSLQGVCLCPGDEKVSLSVLLNHNMPSCTSSQLFKSIAGGSSRVNFSGRIVVARGAQKTDATQESHSLLLSDSAKVDSKPQLEIYADDVKCSHGSTIGRLNEDEQFYMRSRGITHHEAKVLQMISFLSPVFAGIPESAVRDQILEETEAAVRRM